MVKTVMVDNSTHRKLEDIQTEVRNLLNIKVSLGDIVDKIASDNPKEIAKKWIENWNDELKNVDNKVKDSDNGIRVEDIKIKGIDYDVPEIKLDPLNIKKIVYPKSLVDEINNDVIRETSKETTLQEERTATKRRAEKEK